MEIMKSTHQVSDTPREPIRAIPEDEVEFHPLSLADAAGQLFTWKGGLYRGIRPGFADLYLGLARKSLLSKWSSAGRLIPTEVTNLWLPGFAAVLKHRRIDPVSFPTEWPPVMLKQAVLHILDLAIELGHHGLTIKDCHPWNVLFDATRPVYVDLTSIVPKPDGTLWAGYRNFPLFCYHPLLLMYHGYDRLARLMIDEDGGVSGGLTRRLTGRELRHPFRRWERRLRRALPAAVRRNKDDDTTILLRRLRARVESVSYGSKTGALPEQAALREERLIQMIGRTGARSMLDLHCVSPRLPLQLADSGIRVLAFCPEPDVGNALYEAAYRKNLNVLPLVMDIRRPTPGRGLGNSQSVPAEDRFSADVVLARALSAPFIQERPVQLAQLASGLAGFSRERLIIEFQAARDSAEAEMVDRLAGLLRNEFRQVTVIKHDDVCLLDCSR